jgi:hypothetical protein
MAPLDGPETSVQNYHSKLRNIPEERRSQPLPSVFLPYLILQGTPLYSSQEFRFYKSASHFLLSPF